MDYQKTQVLCARVKELENGALPLIDINEIRQLNLYDSYSIAKLEYRRNLLKYEIKYTKPKELYE